MYVFLPNNCKLQGINQLHTTDISLPKTIQSLQNPL